MTFFSAVKICLVKYADFNGRATRAEFWYFTLFVLLLQISFDILDANLAGESFWSYSELAGTFGTIFAVLTFIPAIAVTARRLHDMGKSGWWQLLYLTVVGIIPLVVWLATRTQRFENRFGALPADFADHSEDISPPKWIKFFLIPATGVILSLILLFGALTWTGFIPATKVVSGSELNSGVKIDLLNYKIINEEDDVAYFYSADLFSFTKDGQLITQDGVVTYLQNEDGKLEIYRMGFDEIDRVEIVQEGDFISDSVYRIYGNSTAEYEWIEVWLSNEANGDQQFINHIMDQL